jgi:hypothetical protein
MKDIELCLNIIPVLQSKPHINENGDCFACALSAILNHLFPENAPCLQQVFDYWKHPSIGGTLVLNNTWCGLLGTLKLVNEEFPIEFKYDFIIPDSPERFPYCFWSFRPYHEWTNRLEQFLKEGWVALTVINQDGLGPLDKNGDLVVDNHYIVLDGVRRTWVQHPTVASAHIQTNEIHVVCSAKGCYWIDCRDLLSKYGAAAICVVRRKTNDHS